MTTIKMIINEFKAFLPLRRFGGCMMAGLLCASLVACGKDDTDTKVSLEDGKSTVIYDLAGDTEASMGSDVEGKEKRAAHIFLFRFKDRKQIWIRNASDSAQWLKSADWDIAFTGPYNSEIFVNNAQKTGNPGFGGAAKNTGVVLLKQAYQNVQSAPADTEFANSDLNKIGWAATELSTGWFQYSMNTHIMQALPNRSYIIRLPDGKYAKLQLINAYKGNPPAVTNMNWPAPYFTFRYFVQQDGSKDLKTN
ncbi:HmuY family protein [Sphingobacterium sp. Mn56C]|uniref:HmuY family protein n=1 Tax=Sphingobacterium sp. Mn56C TaxID=3395261 RepID=UPI003BCE7438